MKLQFSDFQSFLWMDGHGPFVWSCYIVTWLGLLYLIMQPRWQFRKFVRQQNALARRQGPRSSNGPEEI